MRAILSMQAASLVSLLRVYYVATILFVLLDVVFDINLRVAFLEGSPTLRALYYAVCFGCAGLLFWKPGLSLYVGTFESLFTVVALTLNMGLRALGGTMAIAEGGVDIISMPELFNFILSGTVAYASWQRGMRQILGNRRF